MRGELQSAFGLIVIVLAAGCQNGPAASAAQPPTAPGAPAPDLAPVPSAGTASVAANTPASAAASSAYPMCGGQKLAGAPSARVGAVRAQLAPAFLEEMQVEIALTRTEYAGVAARCEP